MLTAGESSGSFPSATASPASDPTTVGGNLVNGKRIDFTTHTTPPSAAASAVPNSVLIAGHPAGPSVPAASKLFGPVAPFSPAVDAAGIEFAPEPVPAIRPSKAKRSASQQLLAQAIQGEYRYAMSGLVLGFVSMIGGVVLCLRGVTGSTSWTAKLLGLSSTINDAAPGVVLFVVGLFMVWATRPKVKLKDLKG